MNDNALESLRNELRVLYDETPYWVNNDEFDMLVNFVSRYSQRLIKEVIGNPDAETRGLAQSGTNPKYWTKRTAHRNELRQEQHARARKYGLEIENE